MASCKRASEHLTATCTNMCNLSPARKELKLRSNQKSSSSISGQVYQCYADLFLVYLPHKGRIVSSTDNTSTRNVTAGRQDNSWKGRKLAATRHQQQASTVQHQWHVADGLHTDSMWLECSAHPSSSGEDCICLTRCAAALDQQNQFCKFQVSRILLPSDLVKKHE